MTDIQRSATEARDRAARLLKKKASFTSEHPILRTSGMASEQPIHPQSHEDTRSQLHHKENTYKMDPDVRFPSAAIKSIVQDVLESYLQNESYDSEVCREMTKTVSEVIRSRVKDLNLRRYKLVSLVYIGQLTNQGVKLGSRCLWDPSNDNFSSHSYQNASLFAVATVYGIYLE
ncbi:Tctex1 domain-containing protein 1-B [Trichoplax sp. H2]|uniref:Uncharacterized protein n=1 Tax=Trichoplax adhaerens TaxID=10228 RepID=B3S2I8_TRIAD|nr:hypothetical protein TRIADDRAFT_58041 [Trichoplax adhaerens]EDV23101.1 hypothetical protein TRIADDRAFT_58041 [Trichoplax adhaerens]RDD47729.1 Tctex1 domain-containing protein 1-B [Trichoplax sp. H2]|eukprot:XP_002114011.1 hypothetical protein TRIADDRAFT_58041 [Trichoplax adhaerens]